MADIKTRDAVKGTIKTIDKAAVASERVKAAYAKTKDKAEQGYYADENSATEYATDRVSGATERVTREGVHQFDKQGRKGVKETRENIGMAKNKVADFKQKRAVKAAEKKAAGVSPNSATPSHSHVEAASRTPQTIKTATHSTTKTIKQSARSVDKTVKATAKGTVKTAEKGIKTAKATSKAAIKTTKQAAKTAQATAKATVKTAERAVQATKVAAKATATALKAAVKATISAVKAIIAGTKALIAAIAAGGWVAVVVVIIICLIGLLFGSGFGIFFSGEDTGTGQTMQTAIREINADYEKRLDEIKTSNTHDVLEMSGSRAVWKEVLSVYSIKTTTDPENAMDVATVDDTRKELLKAIFWDMHEVSSSTSTKEDTVIESTRDADGNIIETETTVARTTLYINVAHKTSDEMIMHYGFNAEQKKQLAELLSDDYADLWSMVLYGISNGSNDIVAVALSQLGNVGGQPYWSWYGFGGRVEWCACFVSWCANECGYLETGVIPMFAGCGVGSNWFMDRGQWQDKNFEPMAGAIIFFDWDEENVGQDGNPDHVGIVERVENGVVYTVEGNSGDACRQRQYTVGYYEIYGYGVPAY